VDEKDVGVKDTNLLPPRGKELFVSFVVVVVVVDIVDVVVNNDADAAAGKPEALILSTTIVFVFVVFVVVAKSRCPTSMKDEERPRAAILLHTLIFNIILLI
jgi:protein-S-isoprenylcysteine O-methyltransferase Ste14